ncbi:hypothetical protein HMPREF0322_01876 [Desulfitobacterium hafniense DP7]|uniref:Uncharacterized protein n=1 Tax=Desulfitobacterium hafniense DP7 TaxID=537010 RepID=G9XLP1_DESHA|nr:hypothetical protein HMPREF0322_01876 [Desulfitobacterium hafniense DP7]
MNHQQNRRFSFIERGVYFQSLLFLLYIDNLNDFLQHKKDAKLYIRLIIFGRLHIHIFMWTGQIE